MLEKTFVESEEQFQELFTTQFNVKENAIFAWNIVDKPTHYPCVIIKSCGKYFFVYLEDFSKK